MKKKSLYQVSLLGFILMAASAVTAAVITKEKSSKEVRRGVTLINSTEAGAACNQKTCTFTNAVDATGICTRSELTATTGDCDESPHGTSFTATDCMLTTYENGNETDSTDVAAGSPNTSHSPC